MLSALSILIATAAACSDGAVGPRTSTTNAGGPRLALTTGQLGSGDAIVSVATIKVNPRKDATFNFSNGFVNFPARSICAPSSTYGVGTWDAPCTAVDTAVTITAYSWKDLRGHPVVVFEPSLRFVTTRNTGVALALFDSTASITNVLPIIWCDDATFTCVDESIADPSVKTSYVVSGSVGYLYRRIKHFSGYMVQLGRTTETSTSLDGGTLLDTSF
ncbi:MAG TPA: hypothetical protein VKA84_17645 [Gemmatimonadaceae bacterium]|nr:hypothetical protein [Gemmatimonadaceae bacterium]